jgi:hypothetical protein
MIFLHFDFDVDIGISIPISISESEFRIRHRNFDFITGFLHQCRKLKVFLTVIYQNSRRRNRNRNSDRNSDEINFGGNPRLSETTSHCDAYRERDR